MFRKESGNGQEVARKCREIVKKWSKMVRKLVQDGQEMVQVVGILSELFRK